ncbi:MAG: flagellar basal body rod protein FlgB [Rhizobiaceae bacterium]|nr:flagellar basal body protein [Hyphomicrobiales bacterium]NRB30540.1 flagellar basal body rod protein FlgB [Rhizobiaceae bacterium]
MHSVNLFELASQQAKWATVRQRVIANNIANVNTNGFTPSDVAPFKEVLSKTAGGMSVTNANHIGGGVGRGEFNVTEREATSQIVSESGGKVSIEDELIAAGEVRKAYELNTAIVKSFHRMILMTTRGG